MISRQTSTFFSIKFHIWMPLVIKKLFFWLNSSFALGAWGWLVTSNFKCKNMSVFFYFVFLCRIHIWLVWPRSEEIWKGKATFWVFFYGKFRFVWFLCDTLYVTYVYESNIDWGSRMDELTKIYVGIYIMWCSRSN